MQCKCLKRQKRKKKKSTIPANVLCCLLVGSVDDKDRVVPWYIAPCAYRMKLDPNGPQPREQARQQDQELEGDL